MPIGLFKTADEASIKVEMEDICDWPDRYDDFRSA